MTEHHFETPSPVELYVEIGRGSVQVSATDTTESPSRSSGRDADRVLVEQDGDRLSVVAPQARGGFLGGDARLDVRVVVPHDSSLAIRTGSADIDVDGAVGERAAAQRLGRHPASGRSSGPGLVETGSGDIHVERRAAATYGSRAAPATSTSTTPRRPCSVSTGSGDVAIGTAAGPSVVKTGSGDLSVAESLTDVTPDHRQRRPRRRPRPGAAGSAPRAPPATSGSASRRASRCGPTSPPSPAPSAPTLRGRRRAAGRPGPPRGPRQDRQRRRPAHPRLSTAVQHQPDPPQATRPARPAPGDRHDRQLSDFETSSRRHQPASARPTPRPGIPASPSGTALASRLRRVADRLDG